MQVICNYTNNDKSGFTHQQIYNAQAQGGCLYVNNDEGARVCIGGVALNHTAGLGDESYALARFKQIGES